MQGPNSQDITKHHQALVDELVRRGLLRTRAVEAAFRAVPRHLFLPDTPIEQVYRDEAIVTKWQDNAAISSSSQPAIMAIMLEQLELQPGHNVLEIGAGTGYNAALMGRIVGPGGRVTTVDIDADTVERARTHLAAADAANVEVVCADGAAGYPHAAPYDRMILTAAAAGLPAAWSEQLTASGRLVVPLVLRGSEHYVVAFEHAGDHLASVSVAGGSFMPLRGVFPGPQQAAALALGSTPGYGLRLSPSAAGLGADAAAELLGGPWLDTPTGVLVTQRELQAVHLWLALRAPNVCLLLADREATQRAPYRFLCRYNTCFADGLASEAALSLLVWPPSALEQRPDTAPSELWIRGFGPHEALTRQLAEQLGAWDRAARPDIERLRIRVVPAASAGHDVSQGTQMLFDWR